MKRTVVQGLCIGLVVLASSFSWASKKADAPKAGFQTVDAGSFGVFKGGRRLATETFRVEQAQDSSTTTSEIKLEDGSSHQSSELLLSSRGELRKYSWHEAKPGQSETTLAPGDQILMEHIVDSGQKPHDIPFLVPTSTNVLDDYFFVHREILLWKYIASSCASLADCKLSKSTVGVINPHQQSTYSVDVEYVGQENVAVRGAQQKLRRFNLKSEDGDWTLWIDDQLHLVKISIVGEDTEVVRD
jgi:hypothetical protein